jgi:hypothetical protein
LKKALIKRSNYKETIFVTLIKPSNYKEASFVASRLWLSTGVPETRLRNWGKGSKVPNGGSDHSLSFVGQR